MMIMNGLLIECW